MSCSSFRCVDTAFSIAPLRGTLSRAAAFASWCRSLSSATPTKTRESSSLRLRRTRLSAATSSKSWVKSVMSWSGVASMNFANSKTSGRKWKGAWCGGRRSDGHVADRGNAKVVICGRCISRIRSVDPGRKASGSCTVADEELSVAPSSASSTGSDSSSHLTPFRCLSFTESKHTGQRTHLFSAVPRRWRIHGKQNT